jgi:hypothetical protein
VWQGQVGLFFVFGVLLATVTEFKIGTKLVCIELCGNFGALFFFEGM